MGLVEALQDYVKNMTPRRALSDAAVALSPIPIVGDVVGGVDDAVMYYNDPEERTIGNYGMSLLGMLPFIPAAGVTRRIGEMDFDPRFAKTMQGGERKGDIDRMKKLVVDVAEKPSNIPVRSIVDFEGRPFVMSMSDRSESFGDLMKVNNVDLSRPVEYHGGQNHMFENPWLWSSNPSAVTAIMKSADAMKRLYKQDPLFFPTRMAPTGSDFAQMTGETMLGYAANSMPKSVKEMLNKSMKDFIPDWKGIDNPESIVQFKELPDKKRKAILNVLDRDFRDMGGLNIGEARLSIANPDQLTAREGGLMNVGQFDMSTPKFNHQGVNTYSQGIAGRGIARLKEDIGAFELLPNIVDFKGIKDPKNIKPNEARMLQTNAFTGLLDDRLIRKIMEAQGK